MSAPIFSVTFTVGLIEKLAGIKPAGTKQGAPASKPVDPEVIVLKRRNAQLGSALESSKKVGRFLLKNEEQELAKIRQLSEELLKEHSYPPKPIPCASERRACVGCYKEHAREPLKCAEAVDAYAQCADRVFKGFVRSPQPAYS